MLWFSGRGDVRAIVTHQFKPVVINKVEGRDEGKGWPPVPGVNPNFVGFISQVLQCKAHGINNLIYEQ